MLIGIDASRATAARRTGTENYSLHLIRGLLKLATDHRFRLYFNQAPPDGLFPSGVEQRTLPFPRLWTHLRLSWEMARNAPQLLFVPSHVLPLIHPQRSVVTVHDLGYFYHPEAHTLSQNLYLRWSTGYNARAAARILADSQATSQDLASHYQVPEEKIVVVYPGRDENLAPEEDPAILADMQATYGLTGPYLLYVGTLHPRKNLVRLVQAFSSLLKALRRNTGDASWNDTKTSPSLPNLQLVLAGKRGWLYDDIVSQVQQEGLSERVLLPGYVPDAHLPALLSGAMAFVFPSLYEGFGFPVLEAMACGTPVICSNVSSLPEVAGDAALLIDPLDTESLAQALYQVVTQPELCGRLVEQGFNQAKKFSWQRCAQDTLRVLEDVAHELH